jgi:hypothetical protein
MTTVARESLLGLVCDIQRGDDSSHLPFLESGKHSVQGSGLFPVALCFGSRSL